MLKLTKLLKPAILLSLSLLIFISGYSLAKIGNPLELLKQSKISNNKVNEVTSVPVKLEQELPQYSVALLTPPVNNGGFNFSLRINNISIAPFIAWFNLSKCKFIDSNNIEYNGDIVGTNANIGGVRLPKALLPGENGKLEFQKIGVNLDGGGGVNLGNAISNRCSYDKKGNYICVQVKGIRFKECTAFVSTKDFPATLFPLVVNFPQ